MATIEGLKAELRRERNRWMKSKANFEPDSIDYKRARRKYYEGIHLLLEHYGISGTKLFDVRTV